MFRVNFPWLRGLILIAGVLVALLLPRIKASQSSSPARKSVVVELFTSEGCSSCPPVDQLLGSLWQERGGNGVEVIPLGFHVDYWNFQGWTDRFSSNAYSQRQLNYAERFHLASPYTPQMVFDGGAEFDGHDRTRVQYLIEKAASRPAIAEIEMSAVAEDKLKIKVTASHELKAEVLLAVTEDNLVSRVKSGENSGRELRHYAVVRELRSLGQLRGSFDSTVPLKLKQDWKRNDMRAVVFVQEKGNGAIDGAASLFLDPSKVAR